MKTIRRFLTIYKAYVTSGALACIAVLVVIYVVLPAFTTIWERLRVVEALDHDLLVLRTKQGILESITDSDLETAANGLTIALPLSAGFPNIMIASERLANDTGVTLESLTIGGGTLAASGSAQKVAMDKKTNLPAFTYQMTVTGQISQIRALLERFQTVRRLYRIQTFDLALAHTGQASLSAVARSTVSLTAFYNPAPNTFGKITDPIAALSRAEQDRITQVMSFPDLTTDANGGFTDPLIQGQPIREDPFSL